MENSLATARSSVAFGGKEKKMADGMYEANALIPESSDFSLDAAVAYFGKLRKGQLPAELTTAKGQRKPTGFRVSFGGWCVVAWLESGDEVLADSGQFGTIREGQPAKLEKRYFWGTLKGVQDATETAFL